MPMIVWKVHVVNIIDDWKERDPVVVVVVVVVVGKRRVYISLAIRTRWRLLVVLSINTLSPFC